MGRRVFNCLVWWLGGSSGVCGKDGYEGPHVSCVKGVGPQAFSVKGV